MNCVRHLHLFVHTLFILRQRWPTPCIICAPLFIQQNINLDFDFSVMSLCVLWVRGFLHTDARIMWVRSSYYSLIFQYEFVAPIPSYERGDPITTPFTVFRVVYTICKGPKLDAWWSPTFTSANCRYDIICQ